MCMCSVHNYITYFLRGLAPNRKNYSNKCKNHFNEMKGDVGMSLHEKEGNKKNLHQADNPSLHLCSGTNGIQLFLASFLETKM